MNAQLKLGTEVPAILLRLSPSALIDYQTCPRYYKYRHIDRLEPVERKSYFAHGTAVHAAIEHVVTERFEGRKPDPGAAFDQAWQRELKNHPVIFDQKHPRYEVEATGRALSVDFDRFWVEHHWSAMADVDGRPLVERKFELEVAPGLIFVTRIDALVLPGSSAVTLVDMKTPATASDPIFTKASDQLAFGQWMLEHAAVRLGLPRIEQIGFLEGIKRKVGSQRGSPPQFLEPKLEPAHSAERLAEFESDWREIGEQIQRGVFPRTPRNAFASPCLRCEMRQLCHFGDASGLKRWSQ